MEDFKSLSEQLTDIQLKIGSLENKIVDISTNTEEKDPTPYSITNTTKNPLRISDIATGIDGSLLWNDSELKIPPYGIKPVEPKKGYIRHFHTRYAGGALDINSLEIVEYDIDWNTDPAHSKHSQQFWITEPTIKQVQNTKDENVEKLGTLALIFDADSKQWGASALEIDIEKCYFVQKNINGTIKLDVNGKEMKAPIYNIDPTKTSIVWDTTNLCWRFYAIYAEFPIIPPPTP